MAYDPEKHHRRSIRLPYYDYTGAGAYFVTLCTGGHRSLFGRIEGEEMRRARPGVIADQCWRAIPTHFPQVALDEFIVMPNHVHGIIWIMDAPVDAAAHFVGATHASPLRDTAGMPHGPKQRSLGAMIGSYKSAVSKRVREIGGTPDRPIWQRNYFEHVIRNDVALHRIRQYIVNNPSRWAYDRLNPLSTNPEPEDAWRPDQNAT